jgi:DNA-binding transcriptional LysR family regulator
VAAVDSLANLEAFVRVAELGSITRAARSLSVNDGDALKALAVAGAGLAWVFDFMIAPELASGVLVTVLDEFAVDERPIHALYQSPRHVIPRVRVFLDFASTLLGPPRS